jgi:endonuclease/exonuclease/phosphatase (EEP) superfamily protein YafD
MSAIADVDGQDEVPQQAEPSSRRRRRVSRYGGLAVVAFLAGVTVLVLPDLLFGLDRFTPFAQLVGLRPYLAAGLAGLAPLMLALAGFARRHRRMRAAALGLAAGPTAIVAVAAAMVVPRTLVTPASPDGGPLSVITFNTFNGAADPGEVAALIRAEQPDVVSLIEAGVLYRARLAPLVEPSGYRLITSLAADVDGDQDVSGVTVLVADRLGAVDSTANTTTPFPSIEVTGGTLGELRFVAFHSLAPRRGDVPQWRSDVGRVARWCAGGTPAIIAGDLNATLDHSVLRTAMTGCSDAAAQRGHGLVPTWPTWLPDWLGQQLDHVLATDPIVAESFAAREISGSDHRAVIVQLRLPRQSGATLPFQ